MYILVLHNHCQYFDSNFPAASSTAFDVVVVFFNFWLPSRQRFCFLCAASAAYCRLIRVVDSCWCAGKRRKKTRNRILPRCYTFFFIYERKINVDKTRVKFTISERRLSASAASSSAGTILWPPPPPPPPDSATAKSSCATIKIVHGSTIVRWK